MLFVDLYYFARHGICKCLFVSGKGRERGSEVKIQIQRTVLIGFLFDFFVKRCRPSVRTFRNSLEHFGRIGIALVPVRVPLFGKFSV